jgi:hypothetical protein
MFSQIQSSIRDSQFQGACPPPALKRRAIIKCPYRDNNQMSLSGQQQLYFSNSFLGFFLPERFVYRLLVALGRAGRAAGVARLFFGAAPLRATAPLPAGLLFVSCFVSHVSLPFSILYDTGASIRQRRRGRHIKSRPGATCHLSGGLSRAQVSARLLLAESQAALGRIHIVDCNWMSLLCAPSVLSVSAVVNASE